MDQVLIHVTYARIDLVELLLSLLANETFEGGMEWNGRDVLVIICSW